MKKYFYSLFFSLIVSFQSLAKGASHGEINWWHLGGAYKDNPALGWLFITFFLFIFLCYRFIGSPLKLYLAARSNDIKNAVFESKTLHEEKQKALKVLQDEYAELPSKINEIKQNFDKHAEKEIALMQENYQEQKNKIIENAKSQVQFALEKSQKDLKTKLVLNAIELSLAKIKNTKLDEKEVKASLMKEFNEAKIT